jgi:uncharacterized membrane protein YczE
MLSREGWAAVGVAALAVVLDATLGAAPHDAVRYGLGVLTGLLLGLGYRGRRR